MASVSVEWNSDAVNYRKTNRYDTKAVAFMAQQLLALTLIILSFDLLSAQMLVQGRVEDATTGEGLAVATVQVVGTYAGTIANDDGEFILVLEALPITLRVTYIGYRSEEVRLSELPVEGLEVRLVPIPFVLEETIVTGEDPAVRIMREVIQRKREWRPRVESYKVDAYARRVLENDTSIVVIGEIASEIYWDREKGFREVIKSKRATANVEEAGFNFGSTEDFINLYDDEIEIVENMAIGPTHPEALRHYHFELVGQRSMDDKKVFDISMRPKSKLQTAFVGKLAVLDQEFGMLEVELAPVENITASIPIPIFERFDIAYQQQFRPFAEGVWLPVDFRYEIGIKIGMIGLHFPLIRIKALSRLTNYQVEATPAEKSGIAQEGIGEEALDSKRPEESQRGEEGKKESIGEVALEKDRSGNLEKEADEGAGREETPGMEADGDEGEERGDEQVERAVSVEVRVFENQNRVQVDTVAIRQDSLFARLKDRIPLAERERKAYETIDSTVTMKEAFRPTGFLTRFMKEEEKGIGMNDTEEEKGGEKGSAGGSQGAKKAGRGRGLKPDFKPELWFDRVDAAHLGLRAKKELPRRIFFSANGGYKTGLERWAYGGGLWRSWGEKGSRWLGMFFQVGSRTRYRSDSYERIYNSPLPLLGFSDYYDYYWNESFQIQGEIRLKRLGTRVRLEVGDERHSSLEKSTDFSLRGDVSQRSNPAVAEGRLRSLTAKVEFGGPYQPFGVTANRGVSVELEHGADWLGGDFSFTRYRVALDWHTSTFFKRRLAPNGLDVRLVAGTATGELPPQRFGVLDVGLGPFSPFGAFRSVRGRPYEGEGHAALFWEHNFKTVPFEMLGLWGLVRRGFGLVVHGASGRTWIPLERRVVPGYAPRYVDGFHHELGASLIAYHLFRFDVAKRLDRGGWGVGASIARFDFD